MRSSTRPGQREAASGRETRYNPVPTPTSRLGGRYRDQSDCFDWTARGPRGERRAAFLLLRLVIFAVFVLRAMLGPALDEADSAISGAPPKAMAIVAAKTMRMRVL
jgi:hypothetical protein